MLLVISFCKRVGHGQFREAREIPVCGPEHAHAVKEAKCGNPCIVHERTLQKGGSGDPLECIDVTFAFREESARHAAKESPDSIQCNVNGCGLPKNARVGDDRKKFMNTRPRNAERLLCRDLFRQRQASEVMERHFRSMRIHEYVGVDGDHAP